MRETERERKRESGKEGGREGGRERGIVTKEENSIQEKDIRNVIVKL